MQAVNGGDKVRVRLVRPVQALRRLRWPQHVRLRRLQLQGCWGRSLWSRIDLHKRKALPTELHKYDKVCSEVVFMAGIERLTITLPTDMAVLVKGAVEEGDYASSSEVIREALREWKMKRELQLQKVASLKAEIDRGLADVAAGRIAEFDAERIIERGRKLLAERTLSV